MNTKIVASVVVIAASGLANAWLNHKPISVVIIGSYILLLILSVLDMFGGGIAQLASGLAMVAVVYVLLTEFPWQQLIKLVQGK
jgi:hypothetical protein